MYVDLMADIAASPGEVEETAIQAESDGYDGLAVPETKHDAFTVLALAARATRALTVSSGIAVAFARNPMTVATAANDIQLISEGRFQLGLGSQVKAHIERRFAMPWSHPAARMEEFIRAIRAIWTAWATGERLHFRGDFYAHTLMTDFFNPGPNPYGQPPILLAAVGERMTEVAARVADGMLAHSFTTEAYLRERTRPALRRGRGGSLDGFSVSLSALVVLGPDAASRAAAEVDIRRQIAFYGSTPAYLPVLEQHGWAELGRKLNALSRQGGWNEMAGLIADDVLDAFAVAGDAATVAAALRARFGDIVSRISLYTPYAVDPTEVARVTELLRAP
jgi:probable F420-dependent oxidoreductase